MDEEEDEIEDVSVQFFSIWSAFAVRFAHVESCSGKIMFISHVNYVHAHQGHVNGNRICRCITMYYIEEALQLVYQAVCKVWGGGGVATFRVDFCV